MLGLTTAYYAASAYARRSPCIGSTVCHHPVIDSDGVG